MNKTHVLAKLKEVGLIPILRTPSADDALAIADVLVRAGMSNLEIPLTVPNAIEVIGQLVRKHTGVLIGAGTVLDARQAEACIAVGATFIISPAVGLDTIKYCNDVGVAVLPGALTPTEIVTAWRAGADMVKVFPCSAMGGASYVKAVKAPLPQIELCPTGGVSVETASAFIRAGASALGVGNDLVDLDALRGGRGDLIATRAQRYLEVVREARAAG